MSSNSRFVDLMEKSLYFAVPFERAYNKKLVVAGIVDHLKNSTAWALMV